MRGIRVQVELCAPSPEVTVLTGRCRSWEACFTSSMTPATWLASGIRLGALGRSGDLRKGMFSLQLRSKPTPAPAGWNMGDLQEGKETNPGGKIEALTLRTMLGTQSWHSFLTPYRCKVYSR